MLIKVGICALALGVGSVCVYGETFSLPEGTPPCADGSCVPRRVTNGYYPTKWRRWPVAEPTAPKPGVREGIPAPAVELPPPREETDLPQGALTAPGPAEDYGSTPEYGAPRGAPPLTQPPTTQPPPGRTIPRTGPQPPPELFRDMPRSTPDSRTPRFPSDNRAPRRAPSMASFGGSRPSAVVEELRNEARLEHSDAIQQGRFVPPAALPDDHGSAEPLQRAADIEQSSYQAFAGWRPASDQPVRSNAQAVNDRLGVPWSPTRGIGETPAVALDDAEQGTSPVNRPINTSDPSATSYQRGIGPRLQALRAAVPSESSEVSTNDEVNQRSEPPIRTDIAGPNSSAAVGSRPSLENVRRASATADLTISPPASSTVFTVRSGSDDSWRHGTAVANPLRGNDGGVTKVRWESSASAVASPEAGRVNSANPSLTSGSTKSITPAFADRAAGTAISSDDDVPRNPLR